MEIYTKGFSAIKDLKDYVRLSEPTFFHGNQTSTVIPYDRLNEYGEQQGWTSLTLGNLGQLPQECSLDKDNNLIISGPVTWKQAREFCRSKGRNTMTSPTEELAAILSGVATSCTGERCFGYGTLREQLLECTYLDHQGEEQKLLAANDLSDHRLFQNDEGQKLLKRYQCSYQQYREFKNAPFPRLEKETDLMTGTEGQLGVVINGIFKTSKLENVTYIFLALPKWEEDASIHLDVFQKVQGFREKVYSCEFVDENSWSYLSEDLIPRKGKDIVFLEIENIYFEEVYEKILSQITQLDENDIFEVPESRCRQLRMEIPRAIFEVNSKMGVTKKGTDVQVLSKDFAGLLEVYKSMAKGDVAYNLFGHFGDAHLHFNFMPNQFEAASCQKKLEELYKWVFEVKGSPFAEHGIGMLKQKFIQPFYTDTQYEMFSYLKKSMDPNNQFFPQGFMNMRKTQ
ncbi:MAG: FAD-binding oxidoreductase [Bacteriovoracaceae bacterium]|nr:FAD-binding oxidoreductase [Bacteriovoracaceae bacterium]